MQAETGAQGPHRIVILALPYSIPHELSAPTVSPSGIFASAAEMADSDLTPYMGPWVTPSHTAHERLSSGPPGSNHPCLQVRSGLSSKQDLGHGPPDPWTCSSVPWWHWPGQRCGPSLHQCHSPSPVPWAPEAGRPSDDTLSPGSGHGSPGLCWQSPRPGPVAPQTLYAHCWTRAPSWSPAGSWG